MVLVYSKFGIFIVLGSLLIMAIFSSITNFVSAAIECFGQGSVPHFFCIATVGEGPNAWSFIIECYTDNNGERTCEPLRKTGTPPGFEQSIQNTVNEVAQSNPNDSKDLGGIKTDKGITKSPIE